MTTHAHDITTKRWFNNTMRLSKLISVLREIQAANGEADPHVVIVHQPNWPLEAALLTVSLRSEIIDTYHGIVLNERQGDEETSAELENELTEQLSAGGEVVYLVADISTDYGSPHAYLQD